MVVQENPDFSDTQFFEPKTVSYIWICFGQTQPPIFETPEIFKNFDFANFDVQELTKTSLFSTHALLQFCSPDSFWNEEI